MYRRFALIALTTALTSACSLGPTFEGPSHAGELLRSDTMKVIRTATSAQGCSAIERVSTSILTQPTGEPGRERVSERWVAHGCRQDFPYQVTFTGDGQGGSFLTVRMAP